ncbi:MULTISPECIES: NADH-quinone oxidoreductase subunit N [unclassified Arcicella]|uniref:NADH-quinone oxidoreductase subunit N n=1 Tax=unclassified Arcicella TaxID=2644986 RepID=UPI0028663187|nr:MULTISPECIES: NADH-quinone oxidoreductase subunit N [unclassified Arcicella]MDR6563917.1 NADH-quinone oxidoreductase subunit N [Arcicella sp. BE51]MDR6813670.1 NADH-quinone oxidoreductase subunit N [Arcicella sp. BE140]MDR6824949.1 NADH-quinone oxidoreductase subunit N [Arcicella sp. BE139]
MNAIIALSLFGISNLFLGFLNNRKILLPATLVFVLIALGLNFADWNHEYYWFNNMLKTNNLSVNFVSIILLSTLLVVGISRSFGDDDEHSHPAEYYAILLFSTVGAIMMVTFENLIMLFVGLEILSVSMYVLTGSDKRSLRSNEAALKYFLMGSFATGILLFGVALVYGATGSFDIHGIGLAVAQAKEQMGGAYGPLLYAGVILIMVGLLFKISAAPFHFWTPDVYEGAPSIFTAFMSTVVKTAGIAATYRILSTCFPSVYGLWGNPLVYIVCATLIIGNISAVYQQSFKRMLAYSSISHAGYLLITVLAKRPDTNSSLLFYSLAYAIATITAFAVLIVVSEAKSQAGKADESFDALNGLAKNNPLLAFSLTVSMLSLAGIPLTAGFFGKFFIFSDAFSNPSILFKGILILAILMSAVGVYYYFKPIIAAYMKTGETEKIALSPFYKYILILTTALTIVLGIAPDLVKNIF